MLHGYLFCGFVFLDCVTVAVAVATGGGDAYVVFDTVAVVLLRT